MIIKMYVGSMRSYKINKIHFVDYERGNDFSSALCGYAPSPKSLGWISAPPDRQVECPKCMALNQK